MSAQLKLKESETKEKMQNEVNRIMEDNQNTQEMLQKAKAEIQTTRKQISESIIQSQNTIRQYKDAIKEFQEERERNVQEVLKKQHFQIIQEEVQEECEDGVVRTVTKAKYHKRLNKKVEYKYAFGQRIPKDF